MAACPNATLVAHPKGVPHLIDPTKLIAGAAAVYGDEAFSQHFGTLAPVPASRVVAAEDGKVFDLAGRQLNFIHTPGHANHHGCIHDASSGGIFTGDTFGISYREFDTGAAPWLFAPTTPVAFDPDAWQQSLDRIMVLGPSAVFLTHYCRLDEPSRHVEQVRSSIRALADIAMDLAAQPLAQRQARIKDAVTNHLVNDARAHGCMLDKARIAELLAVDIELNAQGLEVWLRRRAKSSP
jgi:glyoxylase-like metal-dependent hydrolase (beta-lactamase superfamily II)